MERKPILITGACGLVGSRLYQRLAENTDRYDVYGIDRHRDRSTRVHPDEMTEIPDSHFIKAELSQLSLLEMSFQGMDTVVHLAGNPNADASWESVRINNIEGTYHVFEAAKRAGVRRVIFASSIHVSFGYFHNVEPYKSIREGNFENVPKNFDRISALDSTWPINAYGTSKVFGEGLAHQYHSEHGMSCICLRLGGVHSRDQIPKTIAPNACTRNDAIRLIEHCIQAPDTVGFEIFYGLSDSDYRWVDLEHAKKVVGYVPEDRVDLSLLS